MRSGEPSTPLSLRLQGLADCHGRPLNYAALGRRLGASPHRIRRTVEQLEQRGVLRLLQPCGAQLGGRMSGVPILYLVDAGLFVPGEGPPGEVRFRGEMIEHLITRERARCPATRPGHCASRSTVYAPLVLTTPRAAIGFQFTSERFPSRRRWSGLKRCVRSKALDFGFVLHGGNRVFHGAYRVVAVPVGSFMADYPEWVEIAEQRSLARLREKMQCCNRLACGEGNPL